MKLSIIIPQYKETERQMYTLLQMLNLQENVDFCDFEVVICNDHSNCQISEDFVRQFENLNVKLFRTPRNKGSGCCRQYAVDNTQSDYIWFIDADDTVFSVLVLAKLFSFFEIYPETDVFCGKFMQEIVVEGKKQHDYAVMDGITWVHGKIYKRKFLEDNFIRFPKQLRVNEDSYFNSVVFGLSPKKTVIDDVLVVWKANPDSLTRTEKNDITHKGFFDLIKGKDLMLEYFSVNGKESFYKMLVAQSFCYLYFTMQEKDWTDFDNLELKAEIEDAICEFYLKYQVDGIIDENIFTQIYNKVRSSLFSYQTYRESESYEHFFERIIENYKKRHFFS